MPLLVLAQQAANASDDASGRLSMVIMALVVLAVLIAVATVVFWRLTRPEPVEPAMRWTGTPVDEPSATAPPTATPNVVASNGAAPNGAAAAPPPAARAEQPRTAG